MSKTFVFARRALALGVSGTALFAAFVSPAAAQSTGDAPTTATSAGPVNPQAQSVAQGDTPTTEGQDIVVTGTLFRRANAETPSPVSVISQEQITQRGLTTTADVIQSLSAGNGGSVPQGFQNAFASGAQAVSLRGLTTNSTLVLFDGLRPAYYPLADDGQRSIVDLNTIPGAIVDRVETLRDGASSTYGADAVAGVVNVILKKEITGISGGAEAGVTEGYNDGGEQRLRLTAGYGSLAERGFNVYISGEYQHQSPIYAKDRPFPFNTKNLQSIQTGNGYTGANGNTGYLPYSVASSNATIAAVVRPATRTATQVAAGNVYAGTAVPGGKYLVLQQGGCAGQGLTAHNNTAGNYCEQDLIQQYLQLMPDQTRLGGTAHLTVNVGSDAQAYLVGTFYQSTIFQQRQPSTVRSVNPFTTYGIVLPARLANGAINPQDPYALSGQDALLFYRTGDIPVTLKNVSNTYRVAGGIDGKLAGEYSYTLHGTYMRTDLTQSRTGFLSVSGLANAINNGTYNFINPSLNTAAVRAQVAPFIQNRAHTEEAEVQGIISRDFATLPGGPLGIGIGGEFRYENIFDPTANPNSDFIDVNPFNAVGHRFVTSGFFEVNAPVLKELEINASGRYDHYSTHFSHFSPKIGAKFTPFRQFAIRGTYSQGFRAPSIPETNGSTVGFVTYTPPAAVQAAHGGNGYVQSYGLGLTQIGNPNLKPETSRSFTGGVVFEPVRWLSMTFDYYNIHKKDLIFNPADSNSATAYLNGTALPAGVSITPNPVDPDFPNLTPTPKLVNALYINGQSLQTSGIDGQITATIPFGNGMKLTSTLEGTEILDYKINTGVNGVYSYVGTIGSYNVTSASGTPRWRANWQNTLDVSPFVLTATAYYTSGYYGYAADYNGVGSCGAGATPASTYLYNADISRTSGPALQCHVNHFLSVDTNLSVKVNDKFTLYFIVQNLFDVKAPFDPNTYGGNNYNPAWAASGVIGRYLKAGANFKF